MNVNEVARIALLVGEPARAAMLIELMDGRVLSAGELARAARVGPATASRHLAQLVDAGLLAVKPAGRHRYHGLASAAVARMLEGIMQLAPTNPGAGPPRTAVGPKDAALRTARTCYDHLAGRLAVAITDRLSAGGGLVFEDEAGYLNDRGREDLATLGIEVPAAAASKPASGRALCRPCLDWSERRFHVAGRLGAMILAHGLEARWLARRPTTRALAITPSGQMALRSWLGMTSWQAVVG